MGQITKLLKDKNKQKRAQTVPPKPLNSNLTRSNSANLMPLTFSLTNDKVCHSYHLFYFFQIKNKNRNLYQKQNNKRIRRMLQMKSKKILRIKKKNQNQDMQ